MKTFGVVAIIVGALASGCTDNEWAERPVRTWSLVADADGALVDERQSNGGAYPNPQGVESLELMLYADGEICADDGEERWCGGPLEGIPYTTRGKFQSTRLSLIVVDMFGNRIEEVPLADDEQVPPTCFSAMTSRGEPCSLCVDSTGAVVENTCETGSSVDALPRDEDEPSGDTHVVVLQEVVDRTMVGAEAFVAAFNAALRQAGIEATLPAPGDELLFRDFSEGEITISEPSCADVMGYLSDAYDDDHWGTDDYPYGPEAIAECQSSGSCRIAQIATRAMYVACQQSGDAAEQREYAMGVIGAGGYAINAVCPGQDQLPEFDRIRQCVGSPLVVDVAGDGLSLQGLDGAVVFPLLGSAPVATGWLAGSDDVLLAIDLDGDGLVTSGRELFGEASGLGAIDGFAALARYDDDRDGAIDRFDRVFSDLLAWRDDGDARCRPWELLSLEAVGIERIALDARVVDVRDEHGNELGLEASARTAAGRSAPVFDVWFVLGGTVDLGVGPSAGVLPE